MNDKPTATAAEVLDASGLKATSTTCANVATDAAGGATTLTCTISGGPATVATKDHPDPRHRRRLDLLARPGQRDVAKIAGTSCTGS